MATSVDPPEELFIDIDDASMGLYVFPLAVIELKSLPVTPMRQTVMARRTDEGYLLTGQGSPSAAACASDPRAPPP